MVSVTMISAAETDKTGLYNITLFYSERYKSRAYE